MKDKVAATAKDFSGVVNLGKSKRLAGIRASTQKVEQRKDVNKIGLTLLEQARELIDQSIKSVKSSYPEGKRNNLFALRYVSEKKLSEMTVGEVFKLLKLEDKKFKKVLNDDYKEQLL